MSQKKNKIFYGWFVVLSLTMIWTVTQGISVHSFTSYIEPLSGRFGWNVTEITLAVSLWNLVFMLFMPIVGMAIDRYNTRKLVIAGITLMSIGIFLLSWINSLLQFYLCYILMGIGGSTCIATVPMTVVGRWFKKKLSLATSIVMSGASIGGFLVPVVTSAIDMIGWKIAMLIISISMFVVLFLFSLIIRQSPEHYGDLLDGETNDTTVPFEDRISIQDSEVSLGIKQALKSGPFWHISLAFMFHVFAPLAVQVHTMPFLSIIGVDRTTSSLIAGALLVSGLFSRLLFGWLGDKFDRKWVAASGTTMIGISLLMFSYVSPESTWLIIPAVILCGMGWGGATVLHPVLLREYFGVGNLGSIIGFSMGITVIGVIVSPPLTSWIFETFGNYRIVWLILIGVVIFSVVSQLTNPPVSAFRKKREL
jgi:MFS family permease